MSRAEDGSPPFSNHTEWEMWEYHWCDRCLVDAPFRQMDKGTGCPILTWVLVEERVPPQWIEQPFDHYPSDAYHCVEFRPFGWRNPEPRPQPPPQPGDGLFPEPERSRRMLLPAPEMPGVPSPAGIA